MQNIFTIEEKRLIKSLNTPYKIQEHINSLKYNKGKRISVLDVFKQKKADCLEAALFACYILKEHNYKSFLIDLTSVKDEDHVLCIFKKNNRYGSIAQSKFLGLRYRHPVYRSLGELSMSYFDHYYNFQGFFSLRGHSKPMEITFNKENLLSVDFVKTTEINFSKIKHFPLISKDLEKKMNLEKVGKEKYNREIIIFPDNFNIPKRYK